eukprot:scaffold183113_cov34-Prasinocladus_malaysianus.AAC.1
MTLLQSSTREHELHVSSRVTPESFQDCFDLIDAIEHDPIRMTNPTGSVDSKGFRARGKEQAAAQKQGA